MERSRVRNWTRRGFGIAAGGLALAVAELVSPWRAGVKSRKRKKRCKRLRDVCKPGGKRKCCHELRRGAVSTKPGTFCCKKPHTPCGADVECCGNRICSSVTGATGLFCCGISSTTPCAIDADCCTGMACFEGFCKVA